jgi:hypothetical protein
MGWPALGPIFLERSDYLDGGGGFGYDASQVINISEDSPPS